MKKLTRDIGFTTLTLEVSRAGKDYNLLLYGGETPHIGCTVIAVPRHSLTGDGSISCTSSVINITGHKDDLICRPLAEVLCKHTGKTVVCSGGVHMDEATTEQLYTIRNAVAELTDQLTF